MVQQKNFVPTHYPYRFLPNSSMQGVAGGELSPSQSDGGDDSTNTPNRVEHNIAIIESWMARSTTVVKSRSPYPLFLFFAKHDGHVMRYHYLTPCIVVLALAEDESVPIHHRCTTVPAGLRPSAYKTTASISCARRGSIPVVAAGAGYSLAYPGALIRH